jgi:protein kinase A
VACLVAGLEYCHEKKIIHRDIKPENLVIDDAGYLRITDFGIARVLRPENSQDTSGTPGYMAPEVMCRQNHTMAADYFAVGVMAFECMFGRRPYVGKSRKEIRDHILSKQIQIKKGEVPRGWSIEAADFVNKMIQRKPQNRLGSGGAEEIKKHPWLRDFPWDDLYHRRLRAPFVPPPEDNFDTKNINEEWRDLDDPDFKEQQVSLRRNSVQALFNGYYYDFQLAALAHSQARLNVEKDRQSEQSSVLDNPE